MKIVFKGELSPVCKTQIIKRGRRFNKIIITSAIFSVVGTGLYILGFVYNNPLFLYLGRPMFAVAGVLALILLIITKQKGRNTMQCFPKQITINDDYIELLGEMNDNCYSRKLRDVKRVTETETSYVFDFRLPYDVNYVCQKDLITEGTIEEFEKLFDGKIVKESHKCK